MSVNLGSAVGYLDLDFSAFRENLNNAKSTLDQAAKNMQSTTNSATSKISKSFESIGKSLTSFGSKMSLAVTTPLTAAYYKIVKWTTSFESAMSQVQATLGITTEDVSLLNGQLVNTSEALGDLAKKLGAETKFTATEAADAINNLAMAGYNTQQIYDALPTTLSLASAGALDLDYACQLVANGLNVMGLSTNDVAELADKLAVTASSAYGSVSDFGEGLLVCGGQAQLANVNLTDTMTALGILGDNGMSASEGGTMLRNVLKNLYTPTAESAKQLQALGISTANADGSLRDVQDVLQDLDGALSTLTADEKINAMAQIFDTRTIAGANALLSQCGERWDELSGKIDNAAGAADRMAETQLDNLGGSLELLSSAIEGLAVSLGEILSPLIRDIAGKITTWVDKLNSLDTAQKETILKVAAVAAAIGPLLVAVGKAITIIGTLTTKVIPAIKAFGSFSKILSLATSPVAIAVAAIGVLVAAFKTAYDNSETLRSAVSTTFDRLKSVFEGFVTRIKELFEPLQPFFQKLVEVLQTIWNAFAAFIGPVVAGAFEKVVTGIETALNTVASVIGIFISAFQGDWESVWNGAGNLLQTIWTGIWEYLGNILGTIRASLVSALDAITGDWEGTWSAIKEKATVIWQNIADVFSNLWDGILKIWDSFTGIFTPAWDAVWGAIKKTFDTISSGIKKAWTVVLDGLIGAVKGVAKGIGWLLDKLGIDLGKTMLEWADTTTTTGEDVVNAVENVVTKVADTTKTVAKAAIDKVVETTEAVADYVAPVLEEMAIEAAEAYNVGFDRTNKLADVGKEIVENTKETSEEVVATAESTALQIDYVSLDIAASSETAAKEVTVAWEDTAEDTEEALTGSYETAMAKLSVMVEELKASLDGASFDFEEMTDDMVAQIQALADEAGISYDEMLDNFKEAMKEEKKTAKDTLATISDYFDTFKSSVYGVWDAITEYQAQENEQQQDLIQAKIDALEDSYDQDVEKAKEASSNKLKDLETKYNKETTALKNKNQQGLISEKEYESQREQLEKAYTNAVTAAETQLTNTISALTDEKAAKETAYAKEKDELARKQFEANKNTQIAQALIDAAAAIIKTYAQSGWIVGTVLAALLAAETGIQIATIKKQQYTPAFAKGGIVDSPTYALIGEQGREAVIPLENNTEWIDMLAEKLSIKIGGLGAGTYNITFNSPKAIDEFEASRQMRRVVRNLAEGF